MITDDLRDKLTSLARLDEDATTVYDEALKHVKDEEVRRRFTEFRAQHAAHVEALAAAVKGLTGQPADVHVDAMGRVADWVTKIRSITGEHGALEAMHTAEKYHVSHYREAAEWDTGDTTLNSTLKRFYDEERNHLGYVEEKLGVHAKS